MRERGGGGREREKERGSAFERGVIVRMKEIAMVWLSKHCSGVLAL